MTDQSALFILMVMAIVVTAFASLIIRRRYSHWSKRRSLLVSSLPISLAVAILGCFVVLNSLRATVFEPETCGVDACGMAMMFGSIVIVVSVVLFFASLAVATLVRRFAKV
jgi:amino acid transporter